MSGSPLNAAELPPQDEGGGQGEVLERDRVLRGFLPGEHSPRPRRHRNVLEQPISHSFPAPGQPLAPITKTMMTIQSTPNAVPNRRPAPHRGRRATRGASLIEIMVVLVILLIGVFLAIRIFPTGFGILRANENRTLATRLAQQLLGNVRGDQSNLPQGVLFAYWGKDSNGNLVQRFVTCRDNDNLDPYNPVLNAKGEDSCTDAATPATANAYFSDLNKYRFIKGEGVKVPLPTATSFGSGSVYTVKFGPIYIDPAYGDSTKGPDLTNSNEVTTYNSYLAARGGALTGYTVQSGGAGTSTGASGNYVAGYLQNQNTYLIDLGDDGTDAEIMFAPRYATNPARTYAVRSFEIEFSYLNENETAGTASTSQGTATVTVNDLTGGQPTWQPIVFSGGNAKNIVPGSVVVTRLFTRIPSGQAFDAYDPYEFKLLTTNILDNTGNATNYANIGQVAFNPAGANYSENTPYGQRPFQAYLDYAVLDWHIIHEDREVPSTNSGVSGLIPVHTTLSNLKRAGDAETDALGNPTTYPGLYGNAAATTNTSTDSLQVFDLSRAGAAAQLIPGDYNGGNPSAADLQNADYFVDDDPRGGTYRTGTIYVNTNNNRVRSGTQLRILYKADGDWAVSLQKAYWECKQEYDTTTTPAPKPRPTVGVAANFGKDVDPITKKARLWFGKAELNRSFTATIEYKTVDSNGNNVVTRLQPIQFTVDRDGNTASTPGPDDFKYAFLYVDDIVPLSARADFGKAVNSGDVNAWSVVGPATGTSVKTRVIWRDNNSTANRWRVQDMDTYLTPAP